MPLVLFVRPLHWNSRGVVWILALSRHVVFLENYSTIMLLHPHHLHHPHPPFLIFQFLICHSLRKLRRNRSVKAQRMMQRSCHLLPHPVGNYSAPSVPSESLVPLRRFNRQSVPPVRYGYSPERYGVHLLLQLWILFMSLPSISRQQNWHVGAKP